MRSCVEREVGGDADAEIEITSRRGAPGPLQVEGRLAPDGPMIEIRGAGADLSIRLGASAGSLDAPALDRVVAALRGDELIEAVTEERARRIGGAAPAVDRALGGRAIVRAWVDGVAHAPRALAMSDRVGPVDLPEGAEGVLYELVYHLPDGQPLFRCVEEKLDLEKRVRDLWMSPAWCWTPSPDDGRRAFAAVIREPSSAPAAGEPRRGRARRASKSRSDKSVPAPSAPEEPEEARPSGWRAWLSKLFS